MGALVLLSFPTVSPVLAWPTIATQASTPPADSLAAVSAPAIVTAFVAGVVVPMLTDLAAASAAPKWIKSLLATVLSVVAGVVSTVVWDPSTPFTGYLLACGLAFMAAMTAHKAGVSEFVERGVPGGLAARGQAPPPKYHI